MQQVEKKEWVSNLRVLATVSVILLHVAATVLYKYNQVPNSTWWIGNFFDSLVRFSVPLFLLISGTLLLGKQAKVGSFFQKKFTRIILPFAFWSGIYILLNFFETSPFLDKPNEISNSNWIISQFLNGSSYHLWYIYMLLGVYLTIPIINIWIIKAKAKGIELVLLIWCVLILIFSENVSEENFLWDMRYLIGYSGYLILGYYISILHTKNIKITMAAILIFVFGFLITLIGTFYKTNNLGVFDKYYYSYLTPNVLLMAAGIFILFKNWGLNLKSSLMNIRNFIDKHSFGIYLCHVIFLNYLSMLGIDWYLWHPLIGIPITVIMCLTISGATVYAISKIPFGKYISG